MRAVIERRVIDRRGSRCTRWLIVNPHVAAITRVNGTVVLLAAADRR